MTGKVYERGECYKYQLLIKHLLETPLFYAPEQEIVYRDKVRLTYRQLNERIHRLANGLEKLGVKKGDTVCVFDYDSHRFLECFFAIPMMGAVLHTQNWRLSPEQILYTMNHAGDDVVIINSDFLPLLEAVKDKLKTVRKIILIDEDGTKPATALKIDVEYEAMLAASATFYDFPEFDEQTRATIFYTTGTTGDPKGVYFSHRQIVLHAQALILVTSAYDGIGRFNSSDVYMPLTPMFHVHAWGVPFAATMLGIKQVYPGKYEPAMLLKLILTEKVTFSHCVPTIIQMLVSTPVVKQFDLTKWKVVIGGARLPKGLAQAAMEMGIQIYAAYGMSETCPLVSIANLKPDKVGKGMIENVDTLIRAGLPAPLVYARIMGPDGKLLPHDGETTGELVLRAPWLTEGYYNEPEKSKDLWPDGWMHTGDVAYIDPEGYLQITDRIKDVIKTGGEWISSLELENLMSLHEAVAEAAAIGVPDAKWGERPMLVLALKPDFKGKITEEDFKRYMMEASAAGKIPKYGVPDRYVMVDQIPKTSVGKIDKITLRKQFQ